MNLQFEYQVRDRQGRILTGVVEADSRETVIQRLRREGYIVTSVKQKAVAPSVGELLASLRPLPIKELALFSRQFATMMAAGLSLLKCLSILQQQTSNQRLAEAVADIRREVEGGSTLYGAMQRHPRVFPELYVTMLRAGEVGGVLDKVLERLAEHYEKEYELREKVKTATRYPLVIMLFAFGVVILLLTTVVPTFVEMFHSFKAELPLATRILLGISQALTGFWYLWLLLLVGGGFLASRFLATEEGKSWWDRLVLRLPVFGDLTRKVALARVCRTLGTLLATGVPVLQAIEVVAEVAGNRVIGQALLSTRDSIREGEGIAGPLEQTGVFPPLLTQMVAVGEETGNLDGMLAKVADFYDREVKNTTESLASLLEPFLIGFLAIVVGAIIVSTILPIFDLYGHIGGQ